jgi:ABC-type multidrug transport system fused ATPase/permease subunit
MKDIKQKCLGSALDRDCTYYDSTSTGHVVNIMHIQTNVVIDFLTDKLPTLVQMLGAIIAGLALAFYYAWDVALVALAAATVIITLVQVTSAFALKAIARSDQALQRASAFAKEVLSNVRTVFSFDAGQQSAEKYKNELGPALKTSINASFWNGVQIGFMSFCSYAAIPLVLWYGGVRIAQGAYNGRGFLFFFAAVAFALSTLPTTFSHIYYFFSLIYFPTGGEIFSSLSPLLIVVMQIAQNGPKIKHFKLSGLSLGQVKSFLEDESGIKKFAAKTVACKCLKGTNNFFLPLKRA